MKDDTGYAEVVEMVVFCPDWKEKEVLLKRFIRRLIDIEKVQQINEQLLKSELEYEDTETDMVSNRITSSSSYSSHGIISTIDLPDLLKE